MGPAGSPAPTPPQPAGVCLTGCSITTTSTDPVTHPQGAARQLGASHRDWYRAPGGTSSAGGGTGPAGGALLGLLLGLALVGVRRWSRLMPRVEAWWPDPAVANPERPG